MCDTPSLGENDEDEELITQKGEKADIIVAVMDSMSPSLGRVSKMLLFPLFTECISLLLLQV